MTKSEFIQQAALNILRYSPSADVSYIAERAFSLAEKLWEADGNKLHDMKAPIQELANEIARIERRDVAGKERGWGAKAQISGAEIRFLNVCKRDDIETVGDLLKIGLHEFSRMTNVGKLTTRLTTEALQNLYNINWIGT